MELFQLNNWKLDISPTTYTLLPFKKLLDRDKSKEKSTAIQELAYIFHMVDPKSPFAASINEEERRERVIKSTIHSSGWKPDKVVEEAMVFYKELEETVTSKYLESIKSALSQIDKFLREFTSEDKDVEDIVRVNGMIAKSIETIKTIRELETLVKQDKEIEDKLRGGKDRGLFMDDGN